MNSKIMKRRIFLVIAFALSFLMMFGSIAMAEEIQFPSSVPTSEPTKLEIIIKVPPTQTNQANCPPSPEKASALAGKDEEKTSQLEGGRVGSKCNECLTVFGKPGQCMPMGDVPCAYCIRCPITIKCGECRTWTGGCGIWETEPGYPPICVGCGPGPC